MNRLTDEKNIFATIGKAIKNAGLFKDIVLKLATYEDTGLEPEEIEDLKDCIEGEEGTQGTVKDLLELVQYRKLEEQGLLIKLPCKVGDTVYAINCNEIIESTVTEITLNEKGVRYIRLYSTDDRLADFKYDYFKKTVFLTREEAEKAFKGMEEK